MEKAERPKEQQGTLALHLFMCPNCYKDITITSLFQPQVQIQVQEREKSALIAEKRVRRSKSEGRVSLPSRLRQYSLASDEVVSQVDTKRRFSIVGAWLFSKHKQEPCMK
jgi:hypothetical protein